MMAENRKTTMGHITRDHLKQSRITLPNDVSVFKAFDKIISPLIHQMIRCEKENQELTALRDWLLPLLMNGQVRVKGAGVYEMREEELGMVAEGY